MSVRVRAHTRKNGLIRVRAYSRKRPRGGYTKSGKHPRSPGAIAERKRLKSVPGYSGYYITPKGQRVYEWTDKQSMVRVRGWEAKTISQHYKKRR